MGFRNMQEKLEKKLFIFPPNERNAASWKLVKNLIYNIYFQQESKPHRIVKTFYASIIK